MPPALMPTCYALPQSYPLFAYRGGSYNRNGLYRKKCMVRIRKREENGTTDINIYTSYNDNAVWNLPVGIFSGSEAG